MQNIAREADRATSCHNPARALVCERLNRLYPRGGKRGFGLLGDQLPMLDVYYEAWHPAGEPEKIRSREDFLAWIAKHLA